MNLETGVCHFFITLQIITFPLFVGRVKFSLLLFGSSIFELAMQESSLIQIFIVLKHLYHLYISDPFWY